MWKAVYVHSEKDHLEEVVMWEENIVLLTSQSTATVFWRENKKSCHQSNILALNRMSSLDCIKKSVLVLFILYHFRTDIKYIYRIEFNKLNSLMDVFIFTAYVLFCLQSSWVSLELLSSMQHNMSALAMEIIQTIVWAWRGTKGAK